MATHDATATASYPDENSGPLEQPARPTEKPGSANALAFDKRQTLRCLENKITAEQTTQARVECAKKQAPAPALRRSALIPVSTEGSRPLNHVEVSEDFSSNDGSLKPSTADTLCVRPLCAMTPLGVAVPPASINGTTATPRATDGSVDCDGTRETKDASFDSEQINCFTEFRELECDGTYSRDIYKYLRERELEHRPHDNYISNQVVVTSAMRTTLVDWMIKAVEKYKLHEETLFRAVSYVDRFLATLSSTRSELHRVGTASLLVAAKFEEIHPPGVAQLAYLSHNAFTKKQIIKTERMLLEVLSFDLAGPTTNYFFERYAQVDEAPRKVRHLGQYLIELALLDDEPYCRHLPSIIAGAALCFANEVFARDPWRRELVQYSGYEVRSFRDCIRSLYSSFREASTRAERAVYEKFNGERFDDVANVKAPATLPF